MDTVALIHANEATPSAPTQRSGSMRRRSMVLPAHPSDGTWAAPTASTTHSSQSAYDADNVAHVRGIQPRYGATGWLSALKDTLFLFGGCDSAGSPSASLQRVQIMTTQAQQLSFVKGPSARYLHATAVHPRTPGRTFTIGGSGTAVLLEDLWEWHGDKWRELRYAGEGPGKRHSHQAVCTSCGQWLLVVGGSRAPPALAFLAEMNPAYATTGNDSTNGATPEHQEPPLGMCMFNIAAGTWQTLNTSPQLSGRRFFSAFRLGTGAGGSTASSVAASFEFLSSPTRRSGSSLATGVAGMPVVDTVVVSPGTRETDRVVVLRIRDGSIVSEAHIPTPVTDATELSYKSRATSATGRSSLSQDGRYVNPEVAERDARIHPAPSRRAGRAVLHYNKAVDEPADGIDRYAGISRSTSSLQGAPVQFFEFGGAFEGDVTMMSSGAHAVRMPRSAASPQDATRNSIAWRTVTLPPFLDEYDGYDESFDGDPDDASTPDQVIVGAASDASSTASDKAVAPSPIAAPHHPQQHAPFTADAPVQSACVPCRAPPPVKGQQPSPDALMAYLSNLEMSTVVDLPGSAFVFGGRDITDGRISGALLLVNKPAMVAHVKTPSNCAVAGGDGRRMSTRFQAICATMGSMRRKSYTGPKKIVPTAPTEATMETVLCRYQRQAEQEAASERRALADQLADELIESGSIAPSEKERVASDLLQHVDRCGTLTWDVHEHYHDLVEQLRPIGMASPLIADERIVACETAFYLRQSVARFQKAQRHGGGDAQKDVGGSSSAQYKEWYHPPVVTRAEAAALHRLAQLPSKRSATAGTQRATPGQQAGRQPAPPPPPPAPLASTQSCAGRQLQAQLNREERRRPPVGSGYGATALTPQAPPPPPRRRRSPPRTVEQRLISSEARIAVNAPLRFYPR